MLAIVRQIPEGKEGTRETLKRMRDMVRADVLDPRNLQLARQITSGIPNQAWVSEIRAIFNWVRDNIRYSLDPVSYELLQGSQNTIELGAGDCDDFCILLATLLDLSGHPCWFCALGFDAPLQFSHVIVQTRGAGETPTISLDATTTNPMGWFPPGVTCSMRCDI